MKGKIIAAIVSVLLIAGIAVTVGVAVNNRPEVAAKNTVKHTVEALWERDELSPLLDMLKGGSLTLKGEYQGVSLDGKVYFENLLTSGEGRLYAEDICIQDQQESLNFSAFASSDTVYITDCDLLDKTYGFVRGNMETSFSTSVFAAGTESEFALDEDTYQWILTLLRMYDTEKDLALAKDLESMAKKYTGKMEKIFAEHAEITAEEANRRVRGTRMACRVISITVDETALSDMISDLYDEILKDKKLRKLFLTYAEDFSEIYEEDMAAYYDEVLLNEDTWHGWIEAVERRSFKLTVELVTPKSSAVLRQLSVRLDVKGEEEEILFVDLGKDGIKKTDYIIVEYGGTDYVLEIVEDNKTLYEVCVYADKKTMVALEVDRKDECYRLTLADDLVITGEFSKKSDTVTVSVDKIKVGKRAELIDLRVIMDTKDKMPETVDAADVESVFDISHGDWEVIFGRLGLMDTVPEIGDLDDQGNE